MIDFDLNVVLVEPEIPQNTGSIGRLCLATGTTLHLVEPLGFEISDAKLRRAGLDYWEHLRVKRYPGLKEFLQTIPDEAPRFFFTKKAGKTLFELPFQKGAYLFFGKETAGLPEWLIQSHPDLSAKIPMFDDRVRSLNLSNAVSIVVYEAIRQFIN